MAKADEPGHEMLRPRVRSREPDPELQQAAVPLDEQRQSFSGPAIEKQRGDEVGGLVCSLLHFWYDGFIWSVRRKEVGF